MFKRVIVLGTIVFLLFEVLYFNSNSILHEINDSDESTQVYQFGLTEGKDEFLNHYQEIILEDDDDTFVVLTSSKVMQEIEEKYPITMEK